MAPAAAPTAVTSGAEEAPADIKLVLVFLYIFILLLRSPAP